MHNAKRNSFNPKVYLYLKQIFDFRYSSNQTVFQVKEYYLYGDCLSFIVPNYFTKAGLNTVSFYLKIEAKIFIHEKNDFNGPTNVRGAIAKQGKYSSYPGI